MNNERTNVFQKSGQAKAEQEQELTGAVLEVGVKDKKDKARNNILSVSIP